MFTDKWKHDNLTLTYLLSIHQKIVPWISSSEFLPHEPASHSFTLSTLYPASINADSFGVIQCLLRLDVTVNLPLSEYCPEVSCRWCRTQCGKYNRLSRKRYRVREHGQSLGIFCNTKTVQAIKFCAGPDLKSVSEGMSPDWNISSPMMDPKG